MELFNMDLLQRMNLYASAHQSEDDGQAMREGVAEIEALRASLRELHDYLREHGSARDTHEMLRRSHKALHLPE